MELIYGFPLLLIFAKSVTVTHTMFALFVAGLILGTWRYFTAGSGRKE
jgi:hypothetical protein